MVLRQSLLEMIGNTTMINLTSLIEDIRPDVEVYGKCEFENPTLSIKDRMAKHIITKSIESGKLKSGQTIVAASSGNTAASVAFVSAVLGYKCHIITTTKCSQEKRDLAKSYGATVEVVAHVAGDHPENYMKKEAEMGKSPEYFPLDQYNCQLNCDAYYNSLGPEIWSDIEHKMTHLVCGASTGGHVTGLSRYLKEMNKDIQITCIDPAGSAFYDLYHDRQFKADPQNKSVIEGLGKDAITGCLDLSTIDCFIKGTDKGALHWCQRLASKGLLIGGSSGLIFSGAVEIIQRAPKNSKIVVVFPDAGIKYLSKIDFVNGVSRV